MIGSIGVVCAIGSHVIVRVMKMSANPVQTADTGSNMKVSGLRAAILSTRKLMMAVNEQIAETRIQLTNTQIELMNLERAHAHLKKTKQDLELLEQYPDDKLFQKLAADELHAPKE